MVGIMMVYAQMFQIDKSNKETTHLVRPLSLSPFRSFCQPAAFQWLVRYDDDNYFARSLAALYANLRSTAQLN